MKVIDGVEIRDIKESDIVSEPVKKTIRQYVENAKLWKGVFIVFVVSVVAHYLLTMILGDNYEGSFKNTRLGFFLISLLTVSFIVFAILFIREKRFPGKNWHCPTCREEFPYFKSEKECRGKTFLMDCHDIGIRQGKIEGVPFVLPKQCPNCGEKIWKESSK